MEPFEPISRRTDMHATRRRSVEEYVHAVVYVQRPATQFRIPCIYWVLSCYVPSSAALVRLSKFGACSAHGPVGSGLTVTKRGSAASHARCGPVVHVLSPRTQLPPPPHSLRHLTRGRLTTKVNLIVACSSLVSYKGTRVCTATNVHGSSVFPRILCTGMYVTRLFEVQSPASRLSFSAFLTYR